MACLANFLDEICGHDDTAYELYKEALALDAGNAFARAKYASFLARTGRGSSAEIKRLFISALVSCKRKTVIVQIARRLGQNLEGQQC